jgi:uncharacterized membrane protein (DUF2068 family)
MVAPPSVATTRRRRGRPQITRPRGVTLISVWLILFGLFDVGLGVLLIALLFLADQLPVDAILSSPEMKILMNEALSAGVVGAVELVIGMMMLVAAVGMLRMRQWAWLLALIIQGTELLIGMLEHPRAGLTAVNMLIGVLVVFYLNQRSIRMAFQVARHRQDPRGRLMLEEDQEAMFETQRKLNVRE